MEQALLATLRIIGWLGIVFIILVFINTVCGIIYNVSETNEKFSWKKLFRGLSKAAIFYGCASLASVAFTILPFINDMITNVFGIQLITSEYLNTLSTVAVLGIIVTTIVAQGKKALEGMTNLSYVSSDVEKITWKVEEDPSKRK